MAKQNWRQARVRWLAIALVIAGAAALLPAPAGAQFFIFGGPQRPSRPPPPQQRGMFNFPFFGGPGSGPFYQQPAPQQPTESFKAPAPRKYETPPASTVMVIGDTMADWLAYGLEEALSDTPEMGVTRYIRPASGLIRYDAKNDTLEWSATIKDALATEKPSAIVVMLGLNDRLPFRDKAPPKPGTQPPAPAAAPSQAQDKTPDKTTDTEAPSDAAKPNGAQPSIAASETQRQGPPGTYDFHTDKWAELYGKRVDDMIAALKSKGVPVLWVGLPAVYGTRSTGDMASLDEIYRERAARAGIVYVDIWDGFVDESGRYVTQGPDFEGQTRRLRTGDGVHFTKAGAVKLAEFVVQDLHRVMSNHLVPVALPAPEEGPKPGVNGPRPAVGPVLPLTASTNIDGNNLLGDGGRTLPVNSDPVATRVLTHGDPIAAPSGRADDFSWPRPGADANGTADLGPAPAAPPASPAAKGPAAKTDAKKPSDAKSAAKPAPAPAPAAPRPSPRASLDGAPGKPPAAPGGGF
jgi:hypothetical protein